MLPFAGLLTLLDSLTPVCIQRWQPVKIVDVIVSLDPLGADGARIMPRAAGAIPNRPINILGGTPVTCQRFYC